jgi:hypothetical protein
VTVHQRRLKIIQFTIGGTDYSCQVKSWTLDPVIKTGNRVYTFCSAGEGQNTFIEETDGQPTLMLKFLSDWTSAGISTYLTANSMTVAAFQLDHHPDIVGEHVRWTGSVQLQAPPNGGDARVTEEQQVTLPILGATPTFAWIG